MRSINPFELRLTPQRDPKSQPHHTSHNGGGK